MKLVKPNWYGFLHTEVAKKFSGGLTFVNDFCVNGEYAPCAVYRAANPDISKGHKRYMLLSKHHSGQFIVRGMDEPTIKQFRYQDALHCHACDDVIYSVNRHDFRSCTCGSITIDGGRDYTKVSINSGAKYSSVVVDLLTDKISDPKSSRGKKKKKEKVKKAEAKDPRT